MKKTFIWFHLHWETKDLQKHQCMLFETVCPNANLKPSKVQEHFDRCPGGAIVVGHYEKFFRANRGRCDSRTTLPMLGIVSIGKPLSMASYQVAKCI